MHLIHVMQVQGAPMSLLSKILITAGLMFTVGCTAHAHPRHATSRAAAASVNFHWTWIDGHWSHGHWNDGRWAKRPDRHPHVHHSGWHWIDGHWISHGPHSQWVPGHWKRTR